jgi:hypothetical protein
MAASIVQKAQNFSNYQVKPLTVTLPAGTTAGSYLVVVVQAQKSGNPFNVGSLNAKTPNPIVTDDKSNIYTTVDSIVGVTQEVTSGLNQPDASGYYPSAYVYVTAAATGTQSVSLAAFYPDAAISPIQPNGNLASPPNVNGRPVFDGGFHAQVFEVAGLSTGVDVHAHGTSNASALGASLITTSAAAIIFEVGVLIDSSTLAPAATSVLQFSSALNSSHSVVQTRIVGSATASAGFTNALRYTGAVVAVSLK